MFPDGYYPQDPLLYLKTEFEARLRRRPHYSLRAFARDLEMSPAALSEFLKGKSGLSKPRALSIAKKMQLSADHTEHFSDLIVSKFARSSETRDVTRIRARNRVRAHSGDLALDQFCLVADWYHMAILELIELNGRYHSVDALAKALGLEKATIKKALARLERLELIQNTNDGMSTASPKTTVGDETPSTAIRLFHRQILEKAEAALEGQPIREREFQSAVFSIRTRDLDAFKADLQQTFFDLVKKYYNHDAKDAVYCLANQLFRIDLKDEDEKSTRKN